MNNIIIIIMVICIITLAMYLFYNQNKPKQSVRLFPSIQQSGINQKTETPRSPPLIQETEFSPPPYF